MFTIPALIIAVFLVTSPASAGQTDRLLGLQALDQLPTDQVQKEKIRLDLQVLSRAYGPAISKVLVQSPKRLYLRLANGQTILYDDGRMKSPDEKLDHPDLEDMLSQPYPEGRPTALADLGQDPGRIRVEAFFQAVYGVSAQEVQSRLVAVPFLGTTVRFHAGNGAAAALGRVAVRCNQLLVHKPQLRPYLLPLQGTFNYRHIAGTTRLSAHAYGIAIDLHRGTYWRWGKMLTPMELLAVRVAYPQEIVQAFEAEGFIWGGKWFHYDTMHFEYRPELLIKARLAKKPDALRPGH